MKKTLLLMAAALAVTMASSRAETIYAVTSANRILTFDSTTPQTKINAVDITGLPAGENIRSIDFRPFNGRLYGLGSSGRLYIIDPQHGNATAVGDAGAFTLRGLNFGFDFNPMVDRIRVTSNEDQNLRIDPNTGALVASDTTLSYATGDVNAEQDPNIVGTAYTNSFSGAASTVLYDIDSNLDVLVIQDPPNSGQLHTVGPLGADTTGVVGFDISAGGTAYASLSTVIPGNGVGLGAPNSLYTINLATGHATLIGPIILGGPIDEVVQGIAVGTPTRLLNFSARGRVGTGDDVLIGGFISGGASNTRYVLRGMGPSLGINSTGAAANVLPDPMIKLVDQNGTVLQMNDNWQENSDADRATITANGLAPGNPAEAALVGDLPPGAYTAIVSGHNSTTGIGLVEIFQIP
jgi:hypothetical protein